MRGGAGSAICSHKYMGKDCSLLFDGPTREPRSNAIINYDHHSQMVPDEGEEICRSLASLFDSRACMPLAYKVRRLIEREQLHQGKNRLIVVLWALGLSTACKLGPTCLRSSQTLYANESHVLSFSQFQRNVAALSLDTTSNHFRARSPPSALVGVSAKKRISHQQP